VDDVLVCQTSNSQDSEKREVEQGDTSEPTDTLSLDERQFLSAFFLPIANALTDEEVEALVVPPQYDPLHIAGIFGEPYQADDNFLILDEYDPNMESPMFHFDGYVDDDDFEQTVIPLYPRLVKKWRKVPCHQLYQAAGPVLLFINEDDVEPLADRGMCYMVSSAVIIVLLVLFCCIIQEIKAKKYRNLISKEKTKRLLAQREASEGGNYVPPSLRIAVKKKLETTSGEPHIIFI